MNTRSVVTSPPAVAGLALLAVVLGVVFGIRAGFNDDPSGDTGVAGTVIERSETPAPQTAEPSPDPQRPRPDQPSQPPAEPQPEPEVVLAEPEPEPDVGLIPDDTQIDPEPAPEPAPQPRDETDRDPQNRPDPRPQPEPTDEPTREPRPQPTPEPTDEPTDEPSENPAQYALKTGTGHSVHTAESWADPPPAHWEFRTVGRHTGAGSEEPRTAGARLTVQLTNASLRSDATQFQCAAWLNAGDRRLTTDTEHYFKVALVQLDANYTPTGERHEVQLRQAYELRKGASTRSEPLLTNAVDVDPAAGHHYTCEAEYIAK